MADKHDRENDADSIENSQNFQTTPEQNEVLRQSMKYVKDAEVAMKEKGKQNQNASNGDDDGDIIQQYKDLPLRMLICEPILQTARGQQALCDIYVDTIDKLAFEKDADGNKSTKVLTFPYQKPVVDEVTGNVSMQEYQITAPVISLVPLPAFMMEEMTISFSLDVSTSSTTKDHSEQSLESHADTKFWTVSAGIKGKVSSDSTHTRNSDSSAKYNIHVRASQQAPSEGMAKLTSLLAQTMEPINMGK